MRRCHIGMRAHAVIPAQAGIRRTAASESSLSPDSRLRENDRPHPASPAHLRGLNEAPIPPDQISRTIRMTEPDPVSRRRTFAIISHPDAGKTTLTEKMLLFGGAIQLAGEVRAKANPRKTRSDWMGIER